MTDDRDDDALLDSYFDAARRRTPALSEAALARMTAQALAVQAGFASASPAAPAPAPAPRRPGLLAQVLAAVGGWPAMAGLATAGVAGLWIGVMPPVLVQSFAARLDIADTAENDLYLVDPLPGYVLSLNLSEAQ